VISLDERYQVAASLAYGQRDAKLRHGPVRPHWCDDGRRFWYATRDDGGERHVVVDVEALQESEMFDAAALHAALAEATGGPATADAATLSDVSFDHAAQRTTFSAQGGRWAWHGPSRTLARLGDAFAIDRSVSPDGRTAVSLSGPNLRLHWQGQPESVMLTEDGETDWGYGDHVDSISQVSPRLQGLRRKPSVIWSPDSKRIAVLRSDLRKVALQHLVQSVPAEGVRPALHSYRYAMPGDAERARHELWFIGRDGARVRAQVDGLESHAMTPFALGLARWSADGRHFDLLDASRDATRLTLWRIDTRDGSAERLIEETGPGVVRASPSMAEAPIFQRLSDGRLLWWSQRDGWGHLYLIDSQGNATQITCGPWQVRSLLHVDETRRTLLFTAGGREPGVDPYFSLVYRTGFDGSGLALLTPEPAQHEHVSVRPDGECFVDNFSSVTTPPRSVLRDRDGALLMTLETADPGTSWPAAMPLPEPFCVKALDGTTDLWGVLYKPLGFDPAQSHPVVEVIYGAPQTAVAPKTWGSNIHGSVAEQLAALGFVTVIVDGPGTPYRSYAFQLASHGHIESCGGLPDHVHAIRRLAGSRPWMDAERVGIIGGSGGGYATVRAMGTFPEFYKVGVSLCGNHDQAAYLALWGEVYEGLYDEALYAGQASTVVAASISGDLFLIHGEMDDNVHPAMTLRVVDALIKADRRFDMLLVPNADHMLIRLPYVQRRAWDYFVEKLMGEAAPGSRQRKTPR
jgi:dipeptidyl aminopeptidase/acylaminoacyl peptidase